MANIGIFEIWAFGAIVTFILIQYMISTLRRSPPHQGLVEAYDNLSFAVKFSILMVLSITWPVFWAWYYTE